MVVVFAAAAAAARDNVIPLVHTPKAKGRGARQLSCCLGFAGAPRSEHNQKHKSGRQLTCRLVRSYQHPFLHNDLYIITAPNHVCIVNF